MVGPTVGEEATCVKAAGGPQRLAAIAKRQMSWKRGRMRLPPVGRLMREIVAYLNAIRQAFLNAGQGLSG
jgi:hypothetical protein